MNADARWLIEAEKLLRAMDRDDPRYIAGWQVWQQRLQAYEARGADADI